jgi:hypothetical protein
MQQTITKTTRVIAAVLLLAFTFTACKKDKQSDPELPKPTIDNVEIGLNDNEIGIIGRDFHFNVEVLAATKIESISIKIVQRASETYLKEFSYEKSWPQYKDAKNATVHEHFTISEAPEGKYDFLIVVKDQNGSTLEEKRTITLVLPENLPVNPTVTTYTFQKDGAPFYTMTRGGFYDPATAKYGNGSNQINKNQILLYLATIGSTKGDGKMYILMINKKHNHRPETINAIDFSKAIILDVIEHKNVINVGAFTNTRPYPTLSIGSANDNNTPTPNPISGLKAWESGNYYIGVVYNNTTYNTGTFNYIEVQVQY